MKKIVLVVMAVFGLILTGCASKPTGDVRDTSAFKQNKDMGLPAWAGMQFKSGWNKNGYYWKGPVDETGYFASGEAKYSDVSTSTNAADLDGKAQIAFYVKQEINALAQQEANAAGNSSTKSEYEAFQTAVASVKISGIIRVDRFIAEDGKVYVLMFVPENEIKKAMPSDSDFARGVIDKYLDSLDEPDLAK